MKMMTKQTQNTRKFEGRSAVRDANKFLKVRRGWGQWWEMVETNATRILVMRRKNLE